MKTLENERAFSPTTDKKYQSEIHTSWKVLETP